MTTPPLRAVVDASVAVKLFVPEDLSLEAHSVFSAFAADDASELIVPGLFFAECANVFWKWVRRHGYPSANAVGHLHDLGRFGLTVISTQALADTALEIALGHRITAYDACYVAAAARLGLPLITADRKLVTALAKSSFDMYWLGDAKMAD
ncbi:MAG: type II toxin-antitoxin system VapC family toxin [Rhodanobacteraceae bacterium]